VVDRRSADRFDKTAANYAVSPHHRAGRSLDQLVEAVRPTFVDRVLDVACGSGHATVAFAARSHRVVGYDPAPGMLAQTLATAAQRRADNVLVCRGFAEQLPFQDAQFDGVISRIAPHHFSEVAEAVREMARVARAGGRVGISDLCGWEDPEVDELNHQLELLHDPTHVRSYTLQRWRQLFEQAGLDIVSAESFREPDEGLLLTEWVNTAATPPENAAAIARLCEQASPRLRQALGIEPAAGTWRLRQRQIAVVVGRKR
jgi:ubiquinone/menaquinone biosynthesis C-methylase UbiE